MEVERLSIEGLLVLHPQIYADERGHFFESYNQLKFKEFGIPADFVQDNQSVSNKGVLRGLHFQAPPHAQGKLVRVVKGKALDVAVDIRKGSSTYGQFQLMELSESNRRIFWIPEGFAHGFVALEDDTVFLYKCTRGYHKDSEDCIIWNDIDLNINWGIQTPIVSAKDQLGILFKNFISPF